MAQISSFRVEYDRDQDVLYIISRHVPAARGIEDASGIVWRYDNTGELIGATVVDFYDRWFTHQSQLAEELSRHFAIPPSQARVVVEYAFESRKN